MDKSRIAWVDYAKGICIVAVVTFYVTTHVEEIAGRHGWMHQVVAFAQPFRMPDFFLLSGLFVAPVLRRQLSGFIDAKVFHFLYFYVLWITLRMLLQDGRALLGPGAGAVLADYLALYVQPHGQLWFIYLLPAFFLTVRLLRSLPAYLVLAVAVALKLLEPDTGYKLVDRYAAYFVYFHAGYMFAPLLFRFADWTREHAIQTRAWLAGWFGLNLFLVMMHWTYLPGMQLLLGFAGACAVLIASVQLSQVRWMHWLRYLGQHSLVIYLAFVVPMAAMRKLLVGRDLPIDTGTICLLVIVGSICGALLMHRAVRNTPMRWLFDRPSWLRIGRSAPTANADPALVRR